MEIVLPDGVKRKLRYTVGSLKRIRADLGAAVLGGSFSFEDNLGGLIWHGLHDAEGNPPDVSKEYMDDIPSSWAPYLIQRFTMAYTGDNGGGSEKKDAPPTDLPGLPTDPPKT